MGRLLHCIVIGCVLCTRYRHTPWINFVTIQNMAFSLHILLSKYLFKYIKRPHNCILSIVKLFFFKYTNQCYWKFIYNNLSLFHMWFYIKLRIVTMHVSKGQQLDKRTKPAQDPQWIVNPVRQSRCREMVLTGP